MRLIYILILTLLMAGALAAPAAENGGKSGADMPANRESAIEYLKKCELMILSGKDENGGSLTRQHYMAYAMTVHSWLRDPDELEIATGLDRSWFAKIHDKFDEMWAARRQADLDGLEENNGKENEGDKKFEKSVTEFSVLLLKPEDVHPAKLYSLKKIRDAKRKKLRAAQKKAEIEAKQAAASPDAT